MFLHRIIIHFLRYLLVIFVIMLAGSAAAADDTAHSMHAVFVDEPPVIDGILDDSCWKKAPSVSGFIEHKTKKPATEQTIARVLYDNRYIYVGFECIEPDPNKIQATERKRDRRFFGEDHVRVQFDTFNNHRGRYLFIANTLGTQYDARSDVFGWNSSWDCDWQMECRVDKDRWFAEMAIPIGQLHFLRQDNVTWGINFHRTENGKEEESTWSYHDNFTYHSRNFGNLVGLNLSQACVDKKPKLELYGSSTISTDSKGNTQSTGADISMRLNSQLTSAFTINPDFGQVEADTDTIELRDTERYLPERRFFFKDGAEIFSTPINVYYSRRLIDIDLGAKVTGAGKKWNLGLIDVEGEIMRDDQRYGGNFFVGRFTRNINDESHLGFITANSQRENGTNQVGGVDWNINIDENWSWTAQTLALIDRQEIDDDNLGHDTVKQNDSASMTSLNYNKRPFHWHIGLNDISENFQPDLGYIPRLDIRGGNTWFDVKDHVEKGPVKWYRVGTSCAFLENHDSETTLRDYHQWFGLTFRNKFGIHTRRKDDFHSPYKNHSTGWWLNYNSEDYWRSVGGGYSRGKFEEVTYDDFSLGKPFKIIDRLTTKLTGNFRKEYPDGGQQEVWLWQWVNEYCFEADVRLKLTLQKTNQNRHNAMLLFSWLPTKKFDLYIVFTDTRNEDEQEQGIFAKAVTRF